MDRLLVLETADPGGGHCKRTLDVRPVDVLLDVAQVAIDVPGVEGHQTQLEVVGARLVVTEHRFGQTLTAPHTTNTFTAILDYTSVMCIISHITCVNQTTHTHARTQTRTLQPCSYTNKYLWMLVCINFRHRGYMTHVDFISATVLTIIPY